MIKEITVTNDDYKRYCKYAISRSTPEKEKEKGLKPFLLNLIIWFVIAIVFFSIFQSKEFSLSNFHWPTALVTSFPFLVFIVVFISYLKKIEKNSAPKENGLMLGKRIIEIDDSGIKDTNNLGSSLYKWEALEEVVMHEGNVYIFLDTMLAQIIPSCAFENQNEAEEFKKNIEEMHNKRSSTSRIIPLI